MVRGVGGVQVHAAVGLSDMSYGDTVVFGYIGDLPAGRRDILNKLIDLQEVVV